MEPLLGSTDCSSLPTTPSRGFLSSFQWTMPLSINNYALCNADWTQKGHHSTKLLLDKYYETSLGLQAGFLFPT
jgi:hypothetical protein